MTVAIGVAPKWSSTNFSSGGKRTFIRLMPTSTDEKPASFASRCSSSRLGASREAQKRISGLLAYVSSKRFTHGTVVKPDACPDAERQVATRANHAAHFPEGKQFIRKKPQSLLTENTSKRHPPTEDRGRTLKPIDRCAKGI